MNYRKRRFVCPFGVCRCACVCCLLISNWSSALTWSLWFCWVVFVVLGKASFCALFSFPPTFAWAFWFIVSALQFFLLFLALCLATHSLTLAGHCRRAPQQQQRQQQQHTCSLYVRFAGPGPVAAAVPHWQYRWIEKRWRRSGGGGGFWSTRKKRQHWIRKK